MAMFFFYNNKKPRKFDYKPILSNYEEEARQEKLQKRINAIRKELNEPIPEEEKSKKTDFKEEFLSQTKHLKRRKERESDGSKSFLSNNGLLVIILIILLGLFIFWFLR